MDTDSSSIIKMIETTDDDPLEYDELVCAWNALCEKAWENGHSDSGFEDIENAALTNLSAITSTKPAGKLGQKMDRMLESFPHATYMVSPDGQIRALNFSAFTHYNLSIGQKIDDLPFTLPDATTLTTIVRSSLSKKTEKHRAILKRVYCPDDNQEATIAISPSSGDRSSALLFIINAKWQSNAIELLQNQFDLTDTESTILSLFVEGNSLRDIASKRCRSYTTIRTQFQSLLYKTHSGSQTELLRAALSVSDFVTDINALSNIVKHPHRRKAEMFIEGGRIVEVTFMGDFTGTPVLTLPNGVFYTLHAEFENLLFENNLYAVCICLPGYGNTDPVPSDEKRIDRIRKDLVAVMNQLNIPTCSIVAHNTSSPLAYELAALLPDLITHIFQIGACPPVKFSSNYDTESSWANAILNVSHKHPSIKRFLLKSGLKAWAALGAKRFLKLQLSGNKHDAQYLLLPDHLEEIDHALKTVTKFGVDAFFEDSILAFGDWTPHITASRADVTVIHGTLDTIFPINSLRELTEEFSDKMTLIEVENAGFSIMQSHAALIVSQLKLVSNKKPVSSTLH